MTETFAIRLQEKMDKDGGASPVDMDIVRFFHMIIDIYLQRWTKSAFI